MENATRRSFIKTVVMIVSLSASYGLAGFYALRFLYPKKDKKKYRMFVTFRNEVLPGDSLRFQTPQKENYLLTNIGSGLNPYIAFSDRCPHLGCKVHWDTKSASFYCPCHEGVFNEAGVAISGPPQKANQRLKSCQIEVVGSSLYAIFEV